MYLNKRPRVVFKYPLDSSPQTLNLKKTREFLTHLITNLTIKTKYTQQNFLFQFPVDEFESPTIKPEKRFVKWHASATDTEPARDYWTATHYYVSEGIYYFSHLFASDH